MACGVTARGRHGPAPGLGKASDRAVSRGAKRREAFLEVTLEDLRERYSSAIGRRMVLLVDERRKCRGPSRPVARRVDVTGCFPGFLSCKTVPDRRGRTSTIDVSYASLLCGDARLEEVAP